MWKCGECQHEVVANSVEAKFDKEGRYYSCPKCGECNLLICVAASLGNEFESFWLAQPCIFEHGWKPEVV